VKTPTQLSRKLIRQWQSTDLRESRLVGEFSWPIRLSIGKPKAELVKSSSSVVREHLQRWRSEKSDQIEWVAAKYQAAGSAVDIPCYWTIRSVEEWVSACRDPQVSHEFEFLSKVFTQVDQQFHVLLVRQRSLWKNLSIEQLVQCCELALQLEPGCAQGRPLRALTIANIDSKFIENNRVILCKLLNVRFNEALNKSTLEEFLGAALNNDHWLLVIPLAEAILPFQQLRLRASELATIELPCSHIVIVENEQCRYQLPALPNTIAILGAGLNLSWMSNPVFKSRQLAYWGDIDSWGLKMLGMARHVQPELISLMMDEESFEKNQQGAVIEPQIAGREIPAGLTREEGNLYQRLLDEPKGRLEQEFIDTRHVHEILKKWYNP